MVGKKQKWLDFLCSQKTITARLASRFNEDGVALRIKKSLKAF